MNIDFNYCDNIEIENEVIIPEGLTDEEKIKYLTQKINDTNNTLNRLAIILRDFQMIVERNMNVDYTLLQEIQSELYSHTHSFLFHFLKELLFSQTNSYLPFRL